MAHQGTKIEVRIVCDNSKCKKNVEKFILKWYCLTTNRAMISDGKFEETGTCDKSKNIGRFDFPGVRSGQKLDTTVLVDVPNVMAPSVHVSLFTIGYVIQC